MSPKVRKGMIPKPILAMKDKLGENCTADSIMEVEQKLRKSALSSFDRYISKNHSEQYGEYQKIQDYEKKREWMACFINDGDEGLSRMTNTFSRQVTQRNSPASNPIPIRPKVYYIEDCLLRFWSFMEDHTPTPPSFSMAAAPAVNVDAVDEAI
jgi:hypothetical protein